MVPCGVDFGRGVSSLRGKIMRRIFVIAEIVLP